MQFRREIDYALRIMIFFLSLQRDNCGEVVLREICKKTNVPYFSTRRICQTIEQNGWIEISENESILKITPAPIIGDITLHNLLEAFGDEIKPFKVFDRKNEQYIGISKLFETIQEEMRGPVENITLKMVAALNERTDKEY